MLSTWKFDQDSYTIYWFFNHDSQVRDRISAVHCGQGVLANSPLQNELYDLELFLAAVSFKAHARLTLFIVGDIPFIIHPQKELYNRYAITIDRT